MEIDQIEWNLNRTLYRIQNKNTHNDLIELKINQKSVSLDHVLQLIRIVFIICRQIMYCHIII